MPLLPSARLTPFAGATLLLSLGACTGPTAANDAETVALRDESGSIELGSSRARLVGSAPETLALSVALEGQSFRIDLERTPPPTSANYQSFTLRRDGRLVSVPTQLSGCTYEGRVSPIAANGAVAVAAEGWAVLDACSGPSTHPLGQALRGVLRAHGKFWRIEPDATDLDGSDGVLHWAQSLARRDTPGWTQESAVHATLERQPLSPDRRLEFREGTPLETKYIDLIVVNDAARAANVGGLLEADTVSFVAAMNALLAESGVSPRLRVTLRAQVAFEADPYVPAFSGPEVDHDSLLAEFLDWASAEDGVPAHDEHLLLSGLDFLGATAGYAGLSVACTTNSNGFIVEADDAGGGFSVLSAVHELGHTVGMDHDDGTPCPQQGFIMAAVGCANCPIDGAEFSSCSLQDFAAYLNGPAYGEGAYCADDVPPAPGVQSCGDGVVSEGESCDCGADDCSDIDPCCDGATCELEVGAECSDFNDGCCQSCQVVAGDPEVVCRAQRSACDLEEVCNGVSKDCPADTFFDAGGACEDDRGNAGACYFGDCRSRGTQCEQIAEQQGFEGVGVPGPACGNACDQVVCGNSPSGCIIINGGPTVIDGAPCAGGGQCVNQQCVALLDQCPNDAAKSDPGTCGCGVSDADGDADGTADCADGCPDDATQQTPGACGCGTPDTDTDDDGTPNCNDGCPDDPTKLIPGTCGCSSTEADTDGDGALNCNDACPADAERTTPGVCGCGTPDTDTDTDGTPDCNDDCPEDGLSLAPPCGPARDGSEASNVSSFHASSGGGCTLPDSQNPTTRTPPLVGLLLLGLSFATRRARRRVARSYTTSLVHDLASSWLSRRRPRRPREPDRAR